MSSIPKEFAPQMVHEIDQQIMYCIDNPSDPCMLKDYSKKPSVDNFISKIVSLDLSKICTSNAL